MLKTIEIQEVRRALGMNQVTGILSQLLYIAGGHGHYINVRHCRGLSRGLPNREIYQYTVLDKYNSFRVTIFLFGLLSGLPLWM